MNFSASTFVIFLCMSTMRTVSSYPKKYASKYSENSTDIQHVTDMGHGSDTIPCGSPQIKTITFSYNHIEILPPYIFVNKSYKNLHKIDLSHNKINNISDVAFKNLKELKSVDLSENNISTIDKDTFKTNSKLEKLNLCGNRIAFLQDEPLLRSHSLEILILSSNRIEQIFEYTFNDLDHLKHIILDNNIIFMIAPRSFSSQKNLQYLSLANTGVHRLSENMFKTLPRIVDLTNTPLAKKFNPPLKKLKNQTVQTLINIDKIM